MFEWLDFKVLLCTQHLVFHSRSQHDPEEQIDLNQDSGNLQARLLSLIRRA